MGKSLCDSPWRSRNILRRYSSWRLLYCAPFLDWADQQLFAKWIEDQRCGIYMTPENRTVSGFTSAIRKVVGDKLTIANAQNLARELLAKNGVDTAIDRISAFLTDAHPYQSELEQLKEQQDLPCAAATKFGSILYCIMHEPSIRPIDCYLARDTWIKTNITACQKYPVYERDWPVLGKHIDLAVHDLPHASSGVEWWYTIMPISELARMNHSVFLSPCFSSTKPKKTLLPLSKCRFFAAERFTFATQRRTRSLWH